MKKIMKDWILPLLIGVGLAIMIKIFVFDVVFISGQSMEPTFQDRDIVLAEKWSKRKDTLSIGDVVIATTDELNGKEIKLIKRIVAVEGDTVEVKEGVLYRNDVVVEEPYIKEKMDVDFPKTKVKKGTLFLMGDNRNQSSDSREIGVVDKEKIKGRVFIELMDDFFKTY